MGSCCPQTDQVIWDWRFSSCRGFWEGSYYNYILLFNYYYYYYLLVHPYKAHYRGRWRAVRTRRSVLSPLSLSIHSWTSWIHSSITDIWRVEWHCKSACHRHRNDIPWRLMTSAIGAVYIEYKIDPNTEPCGTPQASLCLDEQSLATLTYWDGFER